MNYRHAFHAGNFADVFKHALLARILAYLNRKETPYRVIDTHAGEGAYDLAREEAERTGEWREGIGRLAAGAVESSAADLLRPFLDVVGPCDADGRPALYPGSPLIAQKLTRSGDRLVFCEKHPEAFAALRKRFGRDRRVRTLDLDGWTALGAFVPPPERRGLVLVDPPFEAKDEFATLAKSFAAAHAKWPTGVYALWYPVKNPADARALWGSVRESARQKRAAARTGDRAVCGGRRPRPHRPDRRQSALDAAGRSARAAAGTRAPDGAQAGFGRRPDRAVRRLKRKRPGVKPGQVAVLEVGKLRTCN